MIYFIQVGTDGLIKIGQTAGHVVWRCKQLQQASPHELHILGCHDGGMSDEKALHARFSHARVRSEWFHPVPELLQHITDMDAAAKFAMADAADIRVLVTWSARAHWTAEQRKRYRDEINKLGRSYTAWREYMAPLRSEARAHIEATLRSIGVHPDLTDREEAA